MTVYNFEEQITTETDDILKNCMFLSDEIRLRISCESPANFKFWFWEKICPANNNAVLWRVSIILLYLLFSKGQPNRFYLTFYMNRLLSKRFTWSANPYFLWRKLTLLQFCITFQKWSTEWVDWMGRAKRKGVFEYVQNDSDSDSPHACAKSNPDICSSFIHSVVSSNSVNGQWRPWSDCADAQADLGLRCPYMPTNTFLHGMANSISWEKHIDIGNNNLLKYPDILVFWCLQRQNNYYLFVLALQIKIYCQL